MRTLKNLHIIILLTGLFAIHSCVQNDEFDIPVNQDVTFVPNEGDIVSDIGAVIGEFNQQGGIFDFESLPGGGSRYISGYVVSSDKGGNFFEELVLQDKAENPTSGIVVQIDVNPLYTLYEFGRKVFIKLDGLSVAEDNGVIQIGFRNGTDLEKIPSALRNEHIIRDAEVATIVPLEVSVSEFSEDKENLFIRLTDVQFIREEVLGDRPLTFASETTDQFDGERTLESCADNSKVILSTSTFSDFKSLPLPINRGTIDGILTRDFFDSFYTLVLNSPEDIDFSNTERCDPIILDCGLASAEGTNSLFEDDFETQSTNSLISGNGWTNIIQEGTEGWEAYSAGGSNASLGISARVGSFRSGDARTVSWLITPQINLDAQDGETLTFQTSNSFSDGSELELLFSSDWDGNPANIGNATWGILPAAYITQDSDSFASWFSSGIVDLSCATGSIYIAWRYTGSGDADFDGTYELDEIRIRSN